MTANRDAFIDTWGPRIFRDALLDALDGGDRFSSDPFHVAITVRERSTSGRRAIDPRPGPRQRARSARLAGQPPGADRRRVGCPGSVGRGSHRPSTPPVDIRRLPSRLVTMAWIDDEPERWVERPWFDDFDLVLASTAETVESVRDRSAKVARPLPVHDR